MATKYGYIHEKFTLRHTFYLLYITLTYFFHLKYFLVFHCLNYPWNWIESIYLSLSLSSIYLILIPLPYLNFSHSLLTQDVDDCLLYLRRPKISVTPLLYLSIRKTWQIWASSALSIYLPYVKDWLRSPSCFCSFGIFCLQISSDSMHAHSAVNSPPELKVNFWVLNLT